MAHFLRKATLLLFTDKCLHTYFHELNFLHVECFKATLSKSLGLAIIAGSILVKVPQILKLLQSKSSQGINALSVLMDLFAITAMTSYGFSKGFPFSSYGDGVFLGLQTLVIEALVFHYQGNTAKATAFLSAYAAVVSVILAGMVPLNVLWGCQAMTIPIILTSKLIQAYTNYTNGSTGQLSAATGFMLFFGSLARIFTSIQETGDLTTIIMYVCSTTANAIIVAQILYYWNVTTERAATAKKIK